MARSTAAVGTGHGRLRGRYGGDGRGARPLRLPRPGTHGRDGRGLRRIHDFLDRRAHEPLSGRVLRAGREQPLALPGRAMCSGLSSYLGAFAHEAVQEWLEHSPALYADAIETPLLILHSEKDLRCNVRRSTSSSRCAYSAKRSGSSASQARATSSRARALQSSTACSASRCCSTDCDRHLQRQPEALGERRAGVGAPGALGRVEERVRPSRRRAAVRSPPGRASRGRAPPAAPPNPAPPRARRPRARRGRAPGAGRLRLRARAAPRRVAARSSSGSTSTSRPATKASVTTASPTSDATSDASSSSSQSLGTAPR